ncbi:MAG TPA: DUF5686 family protein [Chlorobiota bacterium]|nr:DUF5686 family protein [Chlorobiota bacterium]
MRQTSIVKGVLALLAVFVASTASVTSQTMVTISGRVVDSATGEDLRFVTLRVVGSVRGVVSSRNGAFVLKVPDGDSTVRIAASLIGYTTDTIELVRRDTNIVVSLREQPLRTADIVVFAENPAMRIMRRVVARKRRQNETLDRYTYMLYTKFVAVTDTLTASRSSGRGDSTVFAILESYSKGYVERPDKFYNEIIQRRQTANIPPQANFVSFGTNLNAYDDEVSIVGERVASPLSADAFDAYDYELTSNEEDSIVRIRLIPKSGYRAFEGELYVDRLRDVPVELRAVPNDNVNLPFDAKLTFRQKFAVYNGNVVPEALSITSTLEANILFVLSPRLDIDIETFCYDYDINASFEDDVFDRRRVEIAESANEFDSTFWKANQKVPLRASEEAAYEEIRIALENPDSLAQSTFIDRFLGPIPRIMTRLGQRPFTGFEDIFRHNRVHGPFLGLGTRFRPDTAIEVYSAAGWGFGNGRPYGMAQLTYFFDQRQRWFGDGSLSHRLQRRDDPFTVRSGLVTVTSLIGGQDYGDYYHATGWQIGGGYTWGQLRFIRNDAWARPSMLRLFVSQERQFSAPFLDTWSVFTPQQRRDQPPVDDVFVRSVGATLWLTYNPARRISRTGMMADIEVSDASVLPTDRDYIRTQWSASVRTATLPLWTLDIGAAVGWSWGDLPIHRLYSLESSVTGLAFGSAFRGMNVKEFYGDRYATLTLSHNFGEVVPGLLRIPDVASFGIEFILTGSAAWTQFGLSSIAERAREAGLMSTDGTADRVYYEVGLALNRILLFFRLDINARLSQRDGPGWRITIGPASF